jgi:hypothetical protein
MVTRSVRVSIGCLSFIIALALLPIEQADAADLQGGLGTMTFDHAVWAEFGLTINNFVGAEANGLVVGPASGVDLLDVATAPGFSVAGPHLHAVNGPGTGFADPSRRTQNPTQFSYDASTPATLVATATGQIGLAGISRWTVAPAFGGGQLLFGDFNLVYNSAGNRWELVNHIDFPSVAFTLANVVTTTGPNGAFSISGDMIGSPILNLLLDGAFGRDFGQFRFETPAPAPSSVPALPGPFGPGLLVVALLASSRRLLSANARSSARRVSPGPTSRPVRDSSRRQSMVQASRPD